MSLPRLEMPCRRRFAASGRTRLLVRNGVVALCTFVGQMAVAPQAFAQTMQPLAFVEARPGLFVHEAPIAQLAPSNAGSIANLGFVVGQTAVAVIDTGGTRDVGERIKAAIRSVTPLPIRYVINTHMHPDHVLGNAAFAGADVAIVGHAKLARALEARAADYLRAGREALGDGFAATAVPPTQTVAVGAPLTIDLGGRTLRLTAHPTAHTDNDMTVLDEASGTLFAGDLLFVRHLPTLDGSLRGWLGVLAALGAQPVSAVVPGHGRSMMPWSEAAAGQQRYLDTLYRQIGEAIAAGRTLADTARHVGQDERALWELFDEYHARNVSAAFSELEWQ